MLPSGRRLFDLWVWFSCRHGWLGSRIWWRVIWSHLVFLTYHTFDAILGHIPPFWSRFVDPPLICMITLGFEIHIRLMIWFHFVLILRGDFLESFSQIHIVWYSRDSWTELSHMPRFPRHHFSGVHIRSFVHPPWSYSRVIMTNRISLTLYWDIFPSFSRGDDRSLTDLLQFPSIGRDILYWPYWSLFLWFSSRWALSGARRSGFNHPTSHDSSVDMLLWDWDLMI